MRQRMQEEPPPPVPGTPPPPVQCVTAPKGDSGRAVNLDSEREHLKKEFIGKTLLGIYWEGDTEVLIFSYSPLLEMRFPK
jgi:hypothetical protein